MPTIDQETVQDAYRELAHELLARAREVTPEEVARAASGEAVEEFATKLKTALAGVTS